MHMILHCSCRR